MTHKSRFQTPLLVLLALLSTAAGKPPASTEIVLWEEEQPDIQGILDETIARFAKERGDALGIRVRRSHFKTEDLRMQFQTGAMAGKGADLVLAPNDFAGVFSTMGLITPVQSWAKMDRFSKQSIDAITDAKGDSWGVPINKGNHLILFVNKTMVPKAPETLEEMIELGKKATDTKAQRYGLAYNVLEPFWFVPFLGAFGEKPLVDRKPTLGTPGMEKALAFVKGLEFDSKIMPSDCDYACAETLFLERKAGMTINGDWTIGKYKAALGDELLIAPLPKLAATGAFMEPMVSGKYLLFNHSLKGAKLEAAKAFAEYMVEPATQEFLASRSKRLPSLKALEDGSFVKSDPLLQASASALAHAQRMPMEVEMRAVWDAIRPQLQEVMNGRVEPKAAASVMQKDAEAKIRDMAH